MSENGLNKLYWGFVFILLGFRIQGFDILPDIIGYLFFASGFSNLASKSEHFSTAAKYNLPMIILSIFSVYQAPAQGEGIHFGPLGILSIPLMIASIVLNLLIVYNLFMGIKDMLEMQNMFDLAAESDVKWNQFKALQIAILFSFVLIFIPPLAFAYFFVLFIVSISVAISILGFIKRCNEHLTL